MRSRISRVSFSFHGLRKKRDIYVIIRSHYRLRHLNGDLKVTVNSQQLTRVTNYRCLGIEVDEAFWGGNAL